MSRLDHAGVLSFEIDRLVSEFSELGFQVVGPHELLGTNELGEPVGLGQFSAHIAFADTYIELTAVPQPGPDHHLKPYFDLGPGTRLVIFGCDDIGASHQELESRDLGPFPVQAASRPATPGEAVTPRTRPQGALLAGPKDDGDDEGPEMAHFRWFGLPSHQFPEALVAFVQHITPELVFRPPVGGHPNGAVKLQSVLVVSQDVETDRRRYQELGCDCQSMSEIDVVDSSDWPFELALSPGETRLAGLRLKVDDLALVRPYLAGEVREINRRDGSQSYTELAVDVAGTVLFFCGSV